jgi:hypothetical protein
MHAKSRDVLAHLTGFHVQSSGAEFVQQLGVEQVHLPKIRLRRILGYSRAMLDSNPEMSVVTHPVTAYKLDASHAAFGKRMIHAAMHGEDTSAHFLAA